MFNSVAKYLWGGAENESDNAVGSQQLSQSPEGPHGDGDLEQASSKAPAEECGEVDDWVLVGEADKENSNMPQVAQHHHNHPHQHHHSHHSSLDSLPQPTAAEVELLDDAASLISQHQNNGDSKSLSDQEDNGMDSGVRPSSPESVFSTCSGRSSATYRPRGVESEAWVVAPPPCFTGSQCGSLTPLESSPLENLLIEHPSMSVYVSQPATNILHSSQADNLHQNLSSNFQELSSVFDISGLVTAFQEPLPVAENGETNTADADTTRALGHRLRSGTPSRRHHADASVHQNRLSAEKILQSQNTAQRKAVSISQQKSISKQKCQRQNQVRDVRSATKGRINKKNKQACPSGFRSSRCVSQRNNYSSAKHV